MHLYVLLRDMSLASKVVKMTTQYNKIVVLVSSSNRSSSTSLLWDKQAHKKVFEVMQQSALRRTEGGREGGREGVSTHHTLSPRVSLPTGSSTESRVGKTRMKSASSSFSVFFLLPRPASAASAASSSRSSFVSVVVAHVHVHVHGAVEINLRRDGGVKRRRRGRKTTVAVAE